MDSTKKNSIPRDYFLNKTFLTGLGVAAAFSGLVYLLIYKIYVPTDIQEHAVMALAILKNQNTYPPNFLYFFLLLLFAKFYWGLNELLLVSLVVLTVSFSAKYFFSYYFFIKQLFSGTYNSKIIILSTIGSLFLAFCFSLPGVNLITKGYYYVGQIPPNVWHNSTEMFLIPFVIWLFIEMGNLISKPTLRSVILCTLLVALNISIKPSYFFCIGPLFPLFLLYQYRLSAQFFLGMIPIAAGFLLLFLQFYYIFLINMGSVYKTEKSSVVFSRPFEIWLLSTNGSMIPLLFLSSCLFPILVFLRLERKKDFYEYFSISSFVLGLLIFIFLKESGPRELHGNFGWQAIVCNFILFLVATRNLISQYFREKNRFFWIATGVFILHFCSGVFYIFRFIRIRDYF